MRLFGSRVADADGLASAVIRWAVIACWLQPGVRRAWLSLFFFKLAAVPLTALVLLLIYRFCPMGRPLQRELPAAIGVGFLMEVLKYVNTLVWPWFQRKLSREYGVFQYSVTLIFLGFLASMLVLAGAEWAARGHRLNTQLEEKSRP